jgi:hypothetical protein
VFVLNCTLIYFTISVTFLYCVCTIDKWCTISVTFLYCVCTVDKGCTISVTFLDCICTVDKGCTISVTFLYCICTVDKGCAISDTFLYFVSTGDKGCTISVTFHYCICTVDKGCTFSSFRREVDEKSFLLGYYAAYSGNSFPTFRDRQVVPKPRQVITTTCCVTAQKKEAFMGAQILPKIWEKLYNILGV